MMNSQELQDHLERYLSTRAALGYKDRGLRSFLVGFLRNVAERQDSGPIRAEIAVDWAFKTPVARGAGLAGPALRLSAARGFLAYLQASDPTVEVPQRRALAVPRPLRPYLYSSEEIASLLKAASELGPRGSLRPHTYKTLLGLIASTGIRVGEAIRLKSRDAELNAEPALLHIRESKFGKTRDIPLHVTTADELQQYARLRTRLEYSQRSDAFFVSEQGRHLNYQCLCQWFIRTRRRLGIHPQEGRRSPTLHGLRHHFAIERLTTWCQQSASVQDLAPHLSVYLGHVSPAQSYWYLTATPALLLTAAESFQRFANPGGAA
jgi:integrase